MLCGDRTTVIVRGICTTSAHLQFAAVALCSRGILVAGLRLARGQNKAFPYGHLK